ncbi:MAG: hypothetical protein J0L81_09895 [Caulobacterales bacterium]|jgi:acyl carrier protein|nr:hypothetical protein [Caulobacterales bacterium]
MSARDLILQALRDAQVAPAAYQAFAEGGTDVRFDAMDMDSLARMEFCISLELNTKISIAPEQLEEIDSLHQLLRMIEQRA